jgi:hypothetical protein
MEKDYVEILGIYPGMYASKFQVRADTWEHFLCSMNLGEAGNCFMPCKDMEGDILFVDMTKLLAFYVLKKEPVKKNKKIKAKK